MKESLLVVDAPSLNECYVRTINCFDNSSRSSEKVNKQRP